MPLLSARGRVRDRASAHRPLLTVWPPAVRASESTSCSLACKKAEAIGSCE
jgi:hypothetical protein